MMRMTLNLLQERQKRLVEAQVEFWIQRQNASLKRQRLQSMMRKQISAISCETTERMTTTTTTTGIPGTTRRAQFVSTRIKALSQTQAAKTRRFLWKLNLLPLICVTTQCYQIVLVPFLCSKHIKAILVRDVTPMQS